MSEYTICPRYSNYTICPRHSSGVLQASYGKVSGTGEETGAANNKDCQLPMEMAEVNSKKPSSPVGQPVGDFGPGRQVKS